MSEKSERDFVNRIAARVAQTALDAASRNRDNHGWATQSNTTKHQGPGPNVSAVLQEIADSFAAQGIVTPTTPEQWLNALTEEQRVRLVQARVADTALRASQNAQVSR